LLLLVNFLGADNDIDRLLKSLDTLEEEGKITKLNQIAELYGKKEPEKSIKYARQALELAEKYHNILEKANALSNVGLGYYYLKDYQQSLKYFESNREYLKRLLANPPENVEIIRLRQLLIKNANNMGTVNETRQDFKAALNEYLEALAVQEKLNNVREKVRVREIAITSINIASIYSELKDFEKALDFLYKALDLARKSDLKSEMLKIYSTLSSVYLALEDYQKAHEYIYLSYELRENIFNEERSKQLAEIQTRYESEKKEKENEILKRENEIKEMALWKQRNLRNSLIALSVLGLLLALSVTNRYRLKTRANKELEKANLEVQLQREALRRAYQKLDVVAREDPLTHLSNRRDMIDKIRLEKNRLERSGKPFVLVMTDIDDFKKFNDNYGHDCGDFILVSISRLIRTQIRKQDWVSRWGGEEFLLLLPETDLEGGRVVSEKIREKVSSTPLQFKGNSLSLTMTFGVSLFNQGMKIDDCLKKADQALYRGKRKGKNRVIVT